MITYNPEAAVGSRLVSVVIDKTPLDLKAEYRMVTIDFLAKGGDNFFSPVFANPTTLKLLDEVLVDYIKLKSPVDIALDGRIKTGKPSKCNKRVRRVTHRRA